MQINLSMREIKQIICEHFENKGYLFDYEGPVVEEREREGFGGKSRYFSVFVALPDHYYRLNE